jgi:hypothetical protein
LSGEEEEGEEEEEEEEDWWLLDQVATSSQLVKKMNKSRASRPLIGRWKNSEENKKTVKKI